MNHLTAILMIGTGGGVGAIARFYSGYWINQFWKHHFPLATFFINVLGSLLIGIFVAFLTPKLTNAHIYQYLLVTGFCGGFTTFSTFSLENLQLIQDGKIFIAFIYMLSSVMISLMFIFVGYTLGKYLA